MAGIENIIKNIKSQIYVIFRIVTFIRIVPQHNSRKLKGNPRSD